MGFEKNYERGLRSATWGKSLRSFAEGDTADQVGWYVERSLCDGFRRGELTGVAALAHQFLKRRFYACRAYSCQERQELLQAATLVGEVPSDNVAPDLLGLMKRYASEWMDFQPHVPRLLAHT